MTMHITDEILMAYADEQLNAERVAEVEAYLRDNHEARQLVEDYKRTAVLVAAAFSTPMEEKTPGRLVEPIRAHAEQQVGQKILTLPVSRRFEHYGMAAAAAIALTVGLALGASLFANVFSPSGAQYVRLGPLTDQTIVADSLERHPSGRTLPVQDGKYLTIIGTFRDHGKRYCREYEILRGQSQDDAVPEAAAIACRKPDATWVVEGAAHVQTANIENGSYVPSGAVEKDALDGLVKILGLGETLAPNIEEELLENGWQVER